MGNKSKSVVVTGASSGIGYSTVVAFLKKGYRVFGSVRKDADAKRLEEELGEQFTALQFDVTDEQAIQAAVEVVEKALKGEGLGCLVNNAGVAIGGPLLHIPLAEVKKQLDINVIGVMAVTQYFLPLLGARKDHTSAPGRIINISSVSGKLSYPFLVPYAASKHALEALSNGLRRELMPYGVDVVIVGPGAVQTPIWGKGIEVGTYKNTDYFGALKFLESYFEQANKKGLSADFLAEKLVSILEKKRPKTRYAFLPNSKFLYWTLPRLLPTRILDKILVKSLKISFD